MHHVAEDRVVVEAGVQWSQVVETTLPLGAAPPALTHYPDLSVGGTLLVGGISSITHHHGLQTDFHHLQGQAKPGPDGPAGRA